MHRSSLKLMTRLSEKYAWVMTLWLHYKFQYTEYESKVKRKTLNAILSPGGQA